MSALLSDLRNCIGVKSCFAFGEVHHITVDTEILSLESLINFLQKKGHTGIHVNPINPTIEDC